ncbi:zta1p [Saccharomyces arboricola H-6]|uniref:Probable quinone oxidoreductase n=1 Tax=Saccharomyces arboricola (strain H-6 / AS 2.3317 / CBS 10644) TaxID=1160507 RepID=J8Q552_SACAR|nr:zta1p [Saccharomyces arboricola H-6]
MEYTIPETQKVVLIDGVGSYNVIKYENYPVPLISDKDLLIKNKYAGVNYIESYFRKGIYPCEKPYVLGREATGTVVARGKGVNNFEIGDQVAYISGSTFAQYTKFSSKGTIVKLPKETSDETMKLYAAGLLQALTALSLTNEAYHVKKGDNILVYAAAGGVGLILNQLLRMKGAHSIAVASTDEKLEIARKCGAEYLINSSKENILERVLEITNGEGVNASFDSVGKDSFETTLAALKRKGVFVSFGNASGLIPPLAINRLSPKNITLVRPQLYGYITTPEEWEYYANKFVDLIDSGKLNIKIYKTYALKDYKVAAADIESRKTVGKLLLEIPQ